MKFFLVTFLSPIWLPILFFVMIGLSVIASIVVSGMLVYWIFAEISKGYIE